MKIYSRMLTAVLVILACLCLALPVFAESGAVAKIEGGAEYESINAALEKAQDGDTVVLLQDTAENVEIIGKKITLDLGGFTLTSKPEEGKEAETTFFSVTQEAVVTVKNGTLAGAVGADGKPVQVEHAVYVVGSTFTLDHATISGHSVATSGGGIYADAAVINVLNGSVVTGNTANGTATTSARAVGNGGGGIYACNGSAVIVNASTVSENKAVYAGGGIFLSASDLTAENNSTIIKNTAEKSNYNSNGGGAVFATNKSSVKLTNCVICHNTSGRYGGGICVYNPSQYGNQKNSLTVVACDISSNNLSSGTQQGVAIYVKAVPTTDEQITIRDSTISNNQTTAHGKGAVFVEGGLRANNLLAVNIENTEFTGNRCTHETSGFSALYITKCKELIISKCTFVDNTGGQAPVTFYTDVNFRFDEVTFKGNSGDYSGGLLFSQDCSGTILNSEFTNNASLAPLTPGTAGAVRIGNNCDISFENCNISGNTSIYGVGGIYAEGSGSDLTLRNTIVTNNSGALMGGVGYKSKSLTIERIGSGDAAIYGNITTDPAKVGHDLYIEPVGTIKVMKASDMKHGDIELKNYAFISGTMDFPDGLTTELCEGNLLNTGYTVQPYIKRYVAQNVTGESCGVYDKIEENNNKYTMLSAAITAVENEETCGASHVIKLIAGEDDDLGTEIAESVTVSEDMEIQLNGRTLKAAAGTGTSITVAGTANLVLSGTGTVDTYISGSPALVVNGGCMVTGAANISSVRLGAGKSVAVTANTKVDTVYLDETVLKSLNSAADDLSVILFTPYNDADLSGLAKSVVLDGKNSHVKIELDESGNVVASVEKLKGVFIDGVNGSDDNSGLAVDAPVKTFEKAKEVLNDSEFNKILVLDTITVADKQEWSLAEGQSMLRYYSCANDLVHVTGELTLKDITIDGNREQIVTATSIAKVSGGKLVLEKGAILCNNENRNARSTTCGGAIYATQAIVEVKGGEIRNNYAMMGGGIYAQTKSTVKVSGGKISSNEAGIPQTYNNGYGGGIAVNYSSAVEITGGEISGNKSHNWAGGVAVGQSAMVGEPCTLMMTDGVIQNNTAYNSGGGIFIQSCSTGTVSGGSITSNASNFNVYAGGGIYVNGGHPGYPDGILKVNNAIVKANSARNGGGVACCETSTVTMYDSKSAAVFRNTASSEVNKAADVFLYWGYFYTADVQPVYRLNEYMLGGGAYNWKNSDGTPVSNSKIVSGESFLSLTSNPSEQAIQAAESEYAANNGVMISGNTAKNGYGGGIGSNGIVIFGEETEDLTFSIDVKKIWDDANTEPEESLTEDAANNRYLLAVPDGDGEIKHPASFKVWLLRNGEKVSFVEFKREAVTIDEKTYYTWPISLTFEKQLKTDGEGNVYTYKIIEELPEDSKYLPAVSGNADEGFVLKNVYEPKAYASIFVKKVLEVPEGLTGGDITGKFTFTLSAEAGIPMPETTSCTNPDKDGGVVIFGEIEYTKPGEYKYTITETGSADGVTNDKDAAKTVTVTVKDNGDGTLTATADSTTEAPLTFTNKYSVEPTTASFPVKKELEVPEGLNPADLTGKFTFTLTADKGIPMPETTSCTNPDKDGGVVTFGEIEYTKPGEYKYTITETGMAAGVTNDKDAAKTVTVTVKDNGDGTLTATASSTADKPLTFTNTYSVEPTTASFPVKKVLEVSEGLTPADLTRKFTFTLTADKGIPMPETTSCTNPDKDGGVVTFGEIEYTKPGEYKYTITETGSADGVTNDKDAAKTVTVTVKDNGDGTLTATADSTTETPLTFTNTYGVEPMTASFPVKKELEVPEGMEGPGSWSYDITVTANDGAPAVNKMTDTVSNDADTVTFGPFTYDKPGTYTYTVTETGTIAGVTNDSAAAAGKTVTVTVVDNKDGTLTATADSTTEAPLTFTNTYSVKSTTASFPVKKVLEVPEGLTCGDITGKFTFTLSAEYGIPMPETTSYTNPDKDGGVVTFGEIEYTKPGEYKYTITETGSADGVTNDKDAAKTVTVTVVDNGDGTLTATADSTTEAPLTFTNTYSVKSTTASFPVKKVLEVPEGLTCGDITGKFTFTLSAEAGIPMPETTSCTNPDKDGGVVTFGEIEFTKPGSYEYTITETGTAAGVTNDKAAAKTVTVTVVDNGDGTLTATASSMDDKPLTFTNTYGVEPTTVAIHVSKVLTGRALNAGEFSFELKNAAGETLQTKANAADGSVVFDAISYAAPGAHAYTIHEVSGDLGGVTYDSGKIEVTVTVVDNGDGTLTATAAYGDKKQFENSYATNDKLMLNGIKNLVGREFRADEVFEVELLQNGTVIQRCMVGAVNGNKAAFSFDPITYTTAEVGTYQYTVREKAGSLKGITYDATQYTVDVTVSDDGKGDLIVDAVYTVNGKAAESIVFTNIYEATGELTLTAEKTVNGIEPTADQVFDFTLSDANGEIETVQNKLGEIEFTKLTYTLDDLGEHTYTVKESKTDKAGYAIDETVYTVKVTVTDNGDGTLKVEKKITANGKPDEGMTFDNKHSATLTISKKVEGCTTEETFPIKVWLFDAKGNELKGEYAYTGDVTGKLTSGTTIELGHGQTITIENLPVGSRYKVEETKDPRFTTTVNSLAMNTAEGEIVEGGNTAAFVNRLITTMFKVRKEWQGGDGGTIILTLYANGEKLEDQPAYTQEGDMYYYTGLPMYDEDGDEIIYSAKEKYVDGYLTIYKNVEPYAEETKAIYNGGTIINKAITTIKVQKVWSGLAEGAEVPEITLILHCNGEVYDRKTPKPDSEGWYVYSNLPTFVNGVRAMYSVTEVPMEGCSTVYTNNGEEGDCAYNGGVITNIVVPKTGDDATVELWMTGLLLSVAAIVLIGKKRTKA